MMKFKKPNKKGILGPVISVFVMVLVISILAGLTFLFVAQLKAQSISTSTQSSFTVLNETGAFLNTSNGNGYDLGRRNDIGFNSPSIILLINASGYAINAGNFTVVNGELQNTTLPLGSWTNSLNVSYTYNAVSNPNAYISINGTEAAGASTVSYLPLIFIALIFGAILSLVLRIILPYINLGQQVGNF
jgi:hypothetical protein